jgi:hypothetical protein
MRVRVGDSQRNRKSNRESENADEGLATDCADPPRGPASQMPKP